MEKTTIEYIIEKDKEAEDKNEIKNELIKKIRNFKGNIKKDIIICRILEEYKKNSIGENSGNALLEIVNQNNLNKQKKHDLKSQLMKVKSEIQRDKRKYYTLKKSLLEEDFSGEDEFSIKKRKRKRDETKVKIEQFNRILKSLEDKKNNIEQEISQIEVVENKKKQCNSRNELDEIEACKIKNKNYKKCTIETLLKYDIGLSKELKKYILNEIKINQKINNNKYVLRKSTFEIIIWIIFVIIRIIFNIISK